MQASETEPNGGIVAATVAAGAGCAALGLITVGAAASSEFAWSVKLLTGVWYSVIAL